MEVLELLTKAFYNNEWAFLVGVDSLIYPHCKRVWWGEEFILLHTHFAAHEQIFHSQQLRAWNTKAQNPNSTVLNGLFFLAGVCLLDKAKVYRMSILRPQTKTPKRQYSCSWAYTPKKNPHKNKNVAGVLPYFAPK